MGNNFKFYTENKLDDNGTYSFTSADEDLANYLYDNNYSTRLLSVGSNDTIDEVYIITLGSTSTISAVGLFNHNLKDFDVKYSDDNQITWYDFSVPINETTNTDAYNFYSFTEVSSVTDIKLTGYTTQIANQQKSIGQFRAIDLIGEVSTNPYNIDISYNENSVIHPLSDGGNVYVQFGSKIYMMIDFDNATEADLVIFRELKNRYAPFFAHPNGGLSTRTQEPFRVQDMFLVNYINPYSPNLKNGYLLDIGTEISLELQEV